MSRKQSQERRDREARRSWANPFVPWGVLTLVGVALTAMYSTGGNEHGASKNPGYDTMPYYKAQGLAGGPNTDPSLIYDARTAGRFVCDKTIVITKNTDGTDTITVRPVRDPASPNPLVLTSISAAGVAWDHATPGAKYEYYNLDGTPSKNQGLTDCPEETITATVVNDGHIQGNRPWVLAGPNSPVEDGSAIPVDLSTAVKDNLAAFNTTGLTDDQAHFLLGQLHQ